MGALAIPLLLLAGCVTARKPAMHEAWHTTQIGLCEDYPEETRSITAARADLAAARMAGARVLRIAFGWDAMEPAKGRYDWSFWDEFVRTAVDDDQIRLIPYVCYTPKWAATDQGENYWRSPPRDPADFGRFITALVHRYHDRIQSWELWNEPDNPAYWLGTSAQFAALVRAGSAAVRAADPHATVVLGGLAGELDFLARLLRDEHLGAAVDVVNIHSYFETWHPSPIEHVQPYVDAAAGLIHDTGGTQGLWMAETGYSSVGERAEVSSVYRLHYRGEHSDIAQAAALVRTFATALATEKLGVLAWYRINDLDTGEAVIGDDNNRHLGLRTARGVAKPALAAFSFLARTFGQPYHTVSLRVTHAGALIGRPEVRGFRLADNRFVVIAWMAMPDEPAAATPQPDDRTAALRITVPGIRASTVTFRDASARPIARNDTVWRRHGGSTDLIVALHGGEVRIGVVSP